jgi:hypothetical protein
MTALIVLLALALLMCVAYRGFSVILVLRHRNLLTTG